MKNQRYIPDSEMYPWYYVWSDAYRIFHETILYGLKDVSGVTIHAIQVPQSIFTRKTDDLSKHFLTGIAIKMHCIVKILKESKDPYVIFSDVDLIVNDKELLSKIAMYEENDITAMSENKEKSEYNIGLLLLKNTPEVLAFFERIKQRVFEEKRLDQDVFNEEINSFSGKHGFFDTKQFIQSSMIRKDIWDSGNYSVIQCLSSDQDSMDKIILGKLATLVYYYDIRHLLQYVEPSIVQELKEYMQQSNPMHYICSLDIESSTKQLSKDA